MSNSPSKKKRTQTRYPLESFPPVFKQMWLAATKKEIVIDFRESYPQEPEKAVSKASHFVLLMNTFRKKYRESGAIDGDILYGAQISRKNGSAVVTLRPAKQEFVSIIEKSLEGIDLEGVELPDEASSERSGSLLDDIEKALKEEDDG